MSSPRQFPKCTREVCPQCSEVLVSYEGGGNDDHKHVSTTRSGPTLLFQESEYASMDHASAVRPEGATDDDLSILPRLALKGEPNEVRDALAAMASESIGRLAPGPPAQ